MQAWSNLGWVYRRHDPRLLALWATRHTKPVRPCDFAEKNSELGYFPARKSFSVRAYRFERLPMSDGDTRNASTRKDTGKARQKRATIRDVANFSGLALSTVSNALSNRRYVTEDTRQKVLQAAEEVGYRVSYIARSMRTQRTFSLGILVGDIANPFFPEIVRGAEDVASAEGYNLILCNTDYREEKQKAYIQILRDQQVDGIIIASQIQKSDEILPLIEEGVPLVLINQRYPGAETDYVGVDNSRGMAEVCEYLWRLGHRKIGFIRGREGSTAAQDRFDGFVQGMKALGGEHDDRLVQPGDWSYGSGATAARRMLAMVNRPTAIIGGNDLMALGAIEAIQEFGLRTPQDISIVGVDDIFVSAMPWASLTTLRHPKWTVGATAARSLIARINDPETPISRVIIPPEFIVRGTSGSVAGKS
jgi:LacI family transcriptional regulator